MIILDVRRGESNNAKLTEQQARALRAEYMALPMQKIGSRRLGVGELAARYGVSCTAATKVGRYMTWRHLK